MHGASDFFAVKGNNFRKIALPLRCLKEIRIAKWTIIIRKLKQ